MNEDCDALRNDDQKISPGVLFTLSLIVITGFVFWAKHNILRDGLKTWIICELQNYYGMNEDCDALRKEDQKISPFYFMSWNFACIFGISAQLILSFHGQARTRATTYIRQQTMKIGAVVVRNSKMDVMSDVDSPQTSKTDVDTMSNPSNGFDDGNNVAMTELKDAQ